MRGRQMDLSGSAKRNNFRLFCTWSRNVDFYKVRGISLSCGTAVFYKRTTFSGVISLARRIVSKLRCQVLLL